MEDAKLLLKRLGEVFSPGDDQRHGLTVNDNGDLVLTLMLGENSVDFTITEAHYGKSVSQLSQEIITSVTPAA